MKMKKIVSLLLIVSMCMIVLTSSPVVGISARGKPVPATLIESPADGATVSDTVTIFCIKTQIYTSMELLL
jgi:hypothetical protein